MSIDSIRAAEIYAEIARAASDAPRAEQTPDVARPDFGALVQDAISGAEQSLKAGETAAAQVAAGQASLVDVVTAVSAAEVTLETAIAVRNRVIEAYQDILRMPI